MEELFKILAFDATLLARRIRELDEEKFLEFVDANCSNEDAEAVRAVVRAVGDKKIARGPSRREPVAQFEVYAREIRAILSDVEFLPTKNALLRCIGMVIGSIPENLVRKGSRDALIEWALRSLAESSESERRTKYRALRKLFLRRRDSSLQDWADIISKPNQ